MMHTKVFDDSQLAEALRRARIGDQFIVESKDPATRAKGEQNRVYTAAKFTGRKIAMRLFRQGWKATVLE